MSLNIYPTRLIPTSKHKFIKNINPEHYLCRWIDSSVEFKDSEGKLSAAAIETRRINKLSMNKIPHSVVEDIFIKIIDKYYLKEWEEGKEGELVPQDKFEYDRDRNYFFLKVGDIEGLEGYFPYPGDADQFDYKFIIRVVHNPLISNFYHCILEIDMYYPDGKKLEKLGKNKSRKILQYEMRQLLIQHAKFEVQHSNELGSINSEIN